MRQPLCTCHVGIFFLKFRFIVPANSHETGHETVNTGAERYYLSDKVMRQMLERKGSV